MKDGGTYMDRRLIMDDYYVALTSLDVAFVIAMRAETETNLRCIHFLLLLNLESSQSPRDINTAKTTT